MDAAPGRYVGRPDVLGWLERRWVVKAAKRHDRDLPLAINGRHLSSAALAEALGEELGLWHLEAPDLRLALREVEGI